MVRPVIEHQVAISRSSGEAQRQYHRQVNRQRPSGGVLISASMPATAHRCACTELAKMATMMA